MKHISISILLGLIILLGYSGCYYDNEAELYPNVTCDSTNVTYSVTISTILQNNCLGCHSQNSPSAGVILEGYDNVKPYTTNGSLYGVVSYATGFTGMPASGKMSACNIALIKKWVDAGAPNN